MSHLKYYCYPGVGERDRQRNGYSQAVRVGDRIECSGQGRHPRLQAEGQLTKYPSGGCDPQTGEFNTEINAQIDQAFANVDLNLKDAGGKGWDQVFRVNSYHVPCNGEAINAMTRNFQKYMPSHAPIWTCIGVTRLGEDDMRVEIEVVADDPDGERLRRGN